MQIRRLPPADLALIAGIDRSEEITVGYAVQDGTLVSYAVDWAVPAWDPSGTGEHSVHHQIQTWRPVLDQGGTLVGAFDGDAPAGLAIVDPAWESGVAWLAFLHVGRPHRRRGAATALWAEVESIAAASGAKTIYVSATPSASAVGFYLSKGCVLAPTPDPRLFAREPEDIHLIRSL